MRKVFFAFCIMMVFVVNSTLLFGGPPVKYITVTVVNTCDWDVPVGLGRDVNMWRFYNEDEKEKLTIQRIPAKSSVIYEGIQAGINVWTFIVFNETTDRYLYKNDLEFLKDTLITVTYDFDKMRYNWTREDR
jgi:hypothetical protein